jgi:polysaccharide export outer membrane protein
VIHQFGTIALISLACLALGCCSSGSDLGPASPEEREALIKSAKTAPPLQVGERIKVTVYAEDALSGEYEIDPAGYVALPLAGNVKVSGLTKLELEQVLTGKFRSKFLRNPKVTVQMASFRPFYVLGEVGKPGEFAYRSGLNVLTALAIAGGTTYRASRTHLLIQHAGDEGFKEYPASPNIPILPGDLIKVPERYF